MAAGRIMGEQAASLLGGKGTVAIITSVGAGTCSAGWTACARCWPSSPG
jgi:ABC-type sugar transport system substrate-binding protein